MITFELAKQLKECDFPDTEQYLFREEGSYCGIEKKNHTKKACNDWDCNVESIEYPNPNLSEIVVACGINFNNLNAVYSNISMQKRQIVGWQAFGVGRGQPEGTMFDSPEEAVAKLWLELHKSNN